MSRVNVQFANKGLKGPVLNIPASQHTTVPRNMENFINKEQLLSYVK